jgi:cytochrome c oxidase subunit IV
VKPASHPLPPAQPGAHHVPFYVLVLTLLALLALTVVTVLATKVQLGHNVNTAIAIVIATIKATLVALYFMHLRYDRPFNAFVLISALFCVMVFIVVALGDTFAYRPNIDEFRAAKPEQIAPAMQQTGAPPAPAAGH